MTDEQNIRMVPCLPCAGTGECPPTDGDTCSWCDGTGEVPAEYEVSYERVVTDANDADEQRTLGPDRTG